MLLTGGQGQPDTCEADEVYVPGDLNDEAFVTSLAQQAAEIFGSVDAVVATTSAGQQPLTAGYTAF